MSQTDPPSDDPLIGQRFGREGVFEIQRRLGEGGMGTVYGAWDHKRSQPRAIKFLNPDQVRSPEMAERFRREGQRFAGLKHDNLVRIHGLGREKSLYYIVSEFVEGVTLHARLRQEPALTVEESLNIGYQIASGLSALHERNVVHRDLKPANIMLTGDPAVVKVLDFGIAKFLDDSTGITQTGYWVGTVGYAAPEQIRSIDIDHRTDLFALGVLLFRMIAGRRPHEGVDDRAIIEATKRGAVERLGKIVKDLPDGVDPLVMRLIERKQAKRPSTTGEVVEALEALQAGKKPPSAEGGGSFFGFGGRR